MGPVELSAGRCQGCGAAFSAETWEPVACTCLGCGKADSLRLPIHGTPSAPLGFKGVLLKMGAWSAAISSRAGARDVLVGACGKCEGPLAAPKQARLSVRCAHCHATQKLPLAEAVADALPNASLSLSSSGSARRFALEWSFEHLVAAVDTPTRCPGCGAPIAPFEGSTRCTHCSRNLLALVRNGQRMLPGVRVRGEDFQGPVDQWMTLEEGAAHYRRYREEFATDLKRTGWMVLGVGGAALGMTGCVMATGALLALAVGGYLLFLVVKEFVP
jgi:hypothetical protein